MLRVGKSDTLRRIAYRGPGHCQRIQGISTNPFTAHKPGGEDRGRECVK